MQTHRLHDLNFTQVIVGANGSGKSTILKLVVRLYDPDDGQILLDGHDIRTLRMYDLRQAVSVLFQDYTHFPLSVRLFLSFLLRSLPNFTRSSLPTGRIAVQIRDNIAIGDPSAAGDDDHVRLAARLGGAEAFIEKLPEGFDTYLDRPVRAHFAGLPEGTKTLFGRTVDHKGMRRAVGDKPTTTTLSGGQMQRLAVARTFMRSLPTDLKEDTRVGLLLFDEPSASLDPTAEHGTFCVLHVM